LTSLSSALHASEAPTGRVIRRHSLLVRVCHWINAGCFVVLLMSGMQIFNADPALTWGPATNFDHPFFSLSARENDDGDPTAGVTTIFGRPFNTTGVLGASRGDDGQLEERGFPSWATLPSYQDLAMGRRWHFFFAWILVVNGLVYFAYLLGRRHIRDLWPSAADIRAIPRAIVSSEMRKPLATSSRAAATAFTALCTWNLPGSGGAISTDQPESASLTRARTQPASTVTSVTRYAVAVSTIGQSNSCARFTITRSASDRCSAATTTGTPRFRMPAFSPAISCREWPRKFS